MLGIFPVLLTDKAVSMSRARELLYLLAWTICAECVSTCFPSGSGRCLGDQPPVKALDSES